MPDSSLGSVGAVVFDLDGTLIDSYSGIASAYQQVLAAMDLGEMDDAAIRSLIGPSIRVVLEDRFGLSGARLDEGVRVFRHFYGNEGLLRYTKYSGIDAMLMELKSTGLDLYIATSKLRDMAMEIVVHAGWADLFTVVGGADVEGTRYRKRDIIEWTLGQGSKSLPPLAMVGDRGVDIAGALALGLRGIGVTWGYGSADELADAGAAQIADTPERVPPAVESLA